METVKMGSLGGKMGLCEDLRHGSSPTSHRKWSSASESDAAFHPSHHPNTKAAELVREIAALELEIVHLEKYILSLYRTVFGRYLIKHPASIQTSSSGLNCDTESSSKDDQDLTECQEKHISIDKVTAVTGAHLDETDQTGNGRTDHQQLQKNGTNSDSPTHSLPSIPAKEEPTTDILEGPSDHSTLADHLCASLRESIFGRPCKLSEDIIRCISAVYCKLNINLTTQTELSSSPVSSLSSSSTFSPKDLSDNWSPRYQYEVTDSPSQLELIKEKISPYSEMIQVTKICIDKQRFKSAATLLENHRCLVRRLETVDPNMLNHEEKLAFWINIHNAMVMHAFIAYGLENNQIRNTLSVLKRSYNVGGVHLNAYEIQRLILGCRSHCPEASIRSLVPPPIKFKTINKKHPYALDRSEPLVHFAVCLGAFSDPAVRVYTSKNVINQLQVAKQEFVQANFCVHKQTRIVLPRILEFYAKDASLNSSALIVDVQDCLSESQQKALQQCSKEKRERCIQWSSYKTSFRYILHRDLDSDKQ